MNINKDTIIAFFTSETWHHIGRAILYYIVGIVIIRLTAFLMQRATAQKVNRQSRMLINKAITYVGTAILLVVVLAEVGVNLTALLGAAGILGLAVGVASQKSLGNILSGLFLLSEKSYEIGDVIKVADKVGVVHDIDLLSVKIRTFDNLLVRIPHETLISTEVTNITRFPIRRMDFEFRVDYSTDLNNLETLLFECSTENSLCLEEPKPFFHLNDWNSEGIGVKFGIWFMKDDYIDVRNSMFRDIYRRLTEEGIRLSLPRILLDSSMIDTNQEPAEPDQ